MPSPKEFFIGVSEFFGSLVPGFVLVGVLWKLDVIGGKRGTPQDFAGLRGAWAAAGVVVTAYVLGNVVSVLAAPLDDTYDAVRKMRWPKDKDHAFKTAERLRDHALGDDKQAMNTYQWARATLRLTSPDAYDDVARLEAASKLFRTLVAVAVVSAGVCAWKANLPGALGSVLAALIAFWPYVDRRYKSTETAYRLVIVHRAAEKAER